MYYIALDKLLVKPGDVFSVRICIVAAGILLCTAHLVVYFIPSASVVLCQCLEEGNFRVSTIHYKKDERYIQDFDRET